jgi:serine protease Do
MAGFQMSHHARNWLKFGSLVALAFVLGLFFAGLLDLPRTSLAQDTGTSGPSIIPVSAPRIPDARPLAELSQAFSSVAEAVRPSVVFIDARRPAGATAARQVIPPGLERLFPDAVPRGDAPPSNDIERATGSGFIVSRDGYILTNHHVIDGAASVKVRLLDGRVFDAAVVGSDKDTDVGVLKIDATDLTPAALGSSAAVRIGEWVLAIGNPLGDNRTFSVTQGIVSAKGRGQLNIDENGPTPETDIQDFIQTDAAINRGNSGGPLVNVRGEVIGINSAIASGTGFYAGYAFAVPIDLAAAVMNQIIAHGRVERTAMGVYVRTATEEDVDYVGLGTVAGVTVQSFPEESPARRAGIKPGEIITAVDGKPVDYVAQLQQRVGFRRPGETVRVTVASVAGQRDVEVRLIGSGPSVGEAPRPVEQLAAPSEAQQNALGTAVETMTPALASKIEAPTTLKGVLVLSIAPGYAANEHLCPADNRRCPKEIIVAVDGKPVRTEADFKAQLAKGGRNGVVSVSVYRVGSPQPEGIERIRLAGN